MKKITIHRAIKKIYMPHKVISPVIETVAEPETVIIPEIIETTPMEEEKPQQKSKKKNSKNDNSTSGNTDNK